MKARLLSYAAATALCLQGQAPDAGKPPAGLTLKPTRTVSFTVDEGTWTSLDVAPDGRTIIFDLLGILYTLPIEGGAAHAITSGLSFNTQPRYSPDGKWIAFVSDRGGANNLWIAHADGSNPRPVTSDLHTLFVSPEWSRNGAYLLVSQKRPDLYRSSFELWQYDVNGGSGVQITKSNAGDTVPPEAWGNALGPSLPPDAKHVYYAEKSGYFADNVKFPLWQIARRNLATGETDVISDAPGSAFRPRISPDGKLMVYATRSGNQTGLRVRNLETGNDRWLKGPVQHDAQEVYFANLDLIPGYAFLPDSSELVLSYGGKIHRLDLANGADRLIPFSAGVGRELGPKLDFPHRVDEGPVRARVIGGARLSPDGKKIAFSAMTRLYVCNRDGSAPRQMVEGEGAEYQPAWSPDGQWLAYVSWFHEAGAIWRVRADGSQAPERLTQVPAYFTNLAWSPDGARIVALRASEHQAMMQSDQWGKGIAVQDLVSIPAAGGAITTIASAKDWAGPHFTSDSDRIYLTVIKHKGALAADYEMLSVRWDGTDRQRLFLLKAKEPWGADFSPVTQLWMHPKGGRALAVYRGQLFLLDVPAVGGEPPSLSLDEPSASVARLTTIGADEAAWSADGSSVTWSLGASFFSLPLADIESRIAETRAAQVRANESATTAGATNNAKAPEEPNTTVWARAFHPDEAAIDIERKRAQPAGTIVLRGARVITMKGKEVLPSADIVVVNNRIQSVRAHGAAPVPANAAVVDVTGDTIMPGFIDTHPHWTHIRRGVLDTENWDFLATLAYGITTGRDPQSSTNDIFPYAELVDAGVILGPRAYTTGPGIFYVNDFQSVADAADVLTRYKKYYGTYMVKSYLVGNRRQREFVVEAAKNLEIMPTTEGAADLALDLTHAIDGFSGNEHQLPVVPIYQDVVNLFARSGIFYTPTYVIEGYDGPGSENHFYQTYDLLDDAKVRRFTPESIVENAGTRMTWYRPDEYVYAQSAAGAAEIVRAGGKVCVGGHGEFQGLSFHWELWSLGAGMTNFEALRAATLTGAEAIGLDADLGSIEAGKLADLVVLSKNPLDDLRNTTALRYVMKNGELFEAATLNEIWPEKKKLPPMWWQQAHP